LIALENTHNRCNGAPLPAAYIAQVGALAYRYGLKLHIDGARIFNAAAALGVAVSALADPADSVGFCLSKGLGAPLGSLICGSREFIAAARRVRKVLGGGMRQAGIPAAAGIVALNEMVARLGDDHANARRLAEGLTRITGLIVNPSTVLTNIVFVGLAQDGPTADSVVEGLRQKGVLCLPLDRRRIRLVTHHHISGDDIDRALEAFERVMAAAHA
jgi:threonine aldolase